MEPPEVATPPPRSAVSYASLVNSSPVLPFGVDDAPPILVAPSKKATLWQNLQRSASPEVTPPTHRRPFGAWTSLPDRPWRPTFYFASIRGAGAQKEHVYSRVCPWLRLPTCVYQGRAGHWAFKFCVFVAAAQRSEPVTLPCRVLLVCVCVWAPTTGHLLLTSEWCVDRPER